MLSCFGSIVRDGARLACQLLQDQEVSVTSASDNDPRCRVGGFGTKHHLHIWPKKKHLHSVSATHSWLFGLKTISHAAAPPAPTLQHCQVQITLYPPTITSLYFTQQTQQTNAVFIFTIIRKQLEINYLKLPAVPRWENFSPAEQKSYDISVGAGVENQLLWYLYCPKKLLVLNKKLLVCLTCLNCEMGGPWNSGPWCFYIAQIFPLWVDDAASEIHFVFLKSKVFWTCYLKLFKCDKRFFPN